MQMRARAKPGKCQQITDVMFTSPGVKYTRCRRYASTFQMLRGTLVLFAGLLTIVLLKRRLHTHHWLGMALIVAGAALVGASSVIFDRTEGQPSQGILSRALSMLHVRLIDGLMDPTLLRP